MIKRRYITLIILALLIIDQITKLLVKCNMTINQAFMVCGDWFQIRFIENPGAAFGMELGGDYGKIALSLFRVVAIIVLGFYINRLGKQGAPKGVIIGFVLILAGALGNILDSAFYGMLFSESTYFTPATFLPEAGGYASFMHGSVVDMLYFPIISSIFPSWLPFVGGENFTFFSPIFNLADTYVSVGVLYLLIFQRKFFK